LKQQFGDIVPGRSLVGHKSDCQWGIGLRFRAQVHPAARAAHVLNVGEFKKQLPAEIQTANQQRHCNRGAFLQSLQMRLGFLFNYGKACKEFTAHKFESHGGLQVPALGIALLLEGDSIVTTGETKAIQFCTITQHFIPRPTCSEPEHSSSGRARNFLTTHVSQSFGGLLAIILRGPLRQGIARMQHNSEKYSFIGRACRRQCSG
jgi:hypothetical protein